jgi:hypothetical protein
VKETAVLSIALPTVPLMIIGFLFVMRTDRRLKARGFALLAWAYVAQFIASVLEGEPTVACIDAALVAFFTWHWWNNGGGDGMRRAWKKFTSRISLSRLAPQTA